MKHVIETKKQKIYFNSYYYVLESLRESIMGCMDYQQICFSDFEEFVKIKCFDENVLYLKKIDFNLEFYYFNKDLLQVRSKMFDLLQIIKKCLKDNVGIYSFETVSYENDNEVYHLGLIDNDLKYINICDVKFVNYDGLLCFVLSIDDTLINHLLKSLDNGQLIHSDFVPNLFGVVLLDDSATLKRVYQTENGWILKAENKDFAPIIVEGDIHIAKIFRTLDLVWKLGEGKEYIARADLPGHSLRTHAPLSADDQIHHIIGRQRAGGSTFLRLFKDKPGGINSAFVSVRNKLTDILCLHLYNHTFLWVGESSRTKTRQSCRRYCPRQSFYHNFTRKDFNLQHLSGKNQSLTRIFLFDTIQFRAKIPM